MVALTFFLDLNLIFFLLYISAFSNYPPLLEAQFAGKVLEASERYLSFHPTPKTVPVKAAKNIKPLVFTPVKIQTQNGRKNEQHHGKVKNNHYCSLQ